MERGAAGGDFFSKHTGAGEFGETLAFADWEERKIVCRPIVCRGSLYLYLHEAGHVNLQHGKYEDGEVPLWLIEYEAEQYAITSMRAAGVAVPREAIVAAKSYVRRCIESPCNDETPPRKVVRWSGLKF